MQKHSKKIDKMMKDTFVIGIVQPSLRRPSLPSWQLVSCCSKEEEHEHGHGQDQQEVTTATTTTTTTYDDDEHHHHHHPLLVEARRICDMMIHHHQQQQQQQSDSAPPATATANLTNSTTGCASSTDTNPAANAANPARAVPVDMYVLPELCPGGGYLEDTFCRYLPSTIELQLVYHQIDELLAETAQQLKSYICYGTIGWKNKSKLKPKKRQKKEPNNNKKKKKKNVDAHSIDDEEHVDNDNCNNCSSNDDDDEYYNNCYYIRQKVVDDNGLVVTQYDKVHLCNYGDCRETTWFTSPLSSSLSSQSTSTTSTASKNKKQKKKMIGSRSDDSSSSSSSSGDDECSSSSSSSDDDDDDGVVSTFIHNPTGWKFGLQICADIRNAAFAREILLDGYYSHHHKNAADDNHPCDVGCCSSNSSSSSSLSSSDNVMATTHVILQPSCFSRDISFSSWKSFRTTRAIENGVYWVGINYAGQRFGQSSCTSPCLLYQPDEDQVEQEEEEEELEGTTNQPHHHERPFVAGCEEGIHVVRLYKETIRYAREDMPRYYQTIIEEHLKEESIRIRKRKRRGRH